MRDVLLGIMTSKCTLPNYLLLVGKLYLWECRRNKDDSNVSPLVYFLDFTNGFRRFLSPRPRKDDRAGIIQNGRLSDQTQELVTKVSKLQSFIDVYLFDVMAPGYD